jgi:hypothetical protein
MGRRSSVFFDQCCFFGHSICGLAGAVLARGKLCLYPSAVFYCHPGHPAGRYFPQNRNPHNQESLMHQLSDIKHALLAINATLNRILEKTEKKDD